MMTDFPWQEMAKLAVSAIALMFFLSLIPVGKKKKLKETWLWKNLGVFVLVGVCMGASFVPPFRTDTPIAFGLISALFAHMGRKAVPKAVRDKVGSLLSKTGNGSK